MNTLRNSNSIVAERGGWLTEDEMRARLPAIFADDKHASRSDRYTFVPTTEILRALDKEGFKPTYAAQSKTRDPEMRGFTKHMLRFRRDFQLGLHDEFPESVLINSHGGQSKYQLLGGVMRLVCLNGLVVSEGTVDEIRVPHKGNIVDNIIEGTFKVVDELDAVKDRIGAWKQLQLTAPEQDALAEAAATVRFNLQPGETAPVTAEQMLRARRYDDRGADLWRTFNRVQENTLRGGLHGVTRDAQNRRRNMTTRDVNGIDQSVSLNRALWTLAQRMADIKNA
jgi:hypothetical protein